jgi:hypothetical protein
MNGKLTWLETQYAATDCDMKEAGLALPFAMLKLDGKTFAIVEEDSYEGESYLVLEIRRRSVRRVLETYAVAVEMKNAGESVGTVTRRRKIPTDH